MTTQREAHGRGTIETREGTEISVFYNMLIELDEEGLDTGRRSGRLSIIGDPWLESTVIEEGHFLVLQDGQRLRVRVQPANRTTETLPFRAALLDD